MNLVENETLTQTDSSYDSIDITDDFMFSYIMRQPDICIELLNYLFPEREITQIKYVEMENTDLDTKAEDAKQGINQDAKIDVQKTLNAIFGKKGIRLDVYFDDGKTVYNIEMQVTNQLALPKRTRFYQAQVDVNLLERGANYDELRPSFIIFICKFDPFDRGFYKYTFQNICLEDKDLYLKDESYKLFFSTVGIKGEISDSLKELLYYMNDTKTFPISETQNNLIHKIDNAVKEAKKDDEWRRAYMTYQLHQRDAELRGEARGREIGQKIGIETKARETAMKLYRRGDDPVEIADIVGYAVETVRDWLGLSPVY